MENTSAVPLRTRTRAQEARLVFTLGWWSVLFAPLGAVAWWRGSRLLREMDALGVSQSRREAVAGRAMGILMLSGIVIAVAIALAGGTSVPA